MIVGDRGPLASFGAGLAAKNFNTVLRSLLRFLVLDGSVPRDLSVSVLSVAGYRHGRLPKSLDPEGVARLLATCAGQRRARRRDLAILTVVVRLGLRAGEVAVLALGDVDWRAGEIVVHGKGGRQDRLPLPTDVGAAIVDYLRHERPPRTSRSVFILAVAPRTGISAKTVGGLVRCTGARAGLAPIGPAPAAAYGGDRDAARRRLPCPCRDRPGPSASAPPSRRCDVVSVSGGASGRRAGAGRPARGDHPQRRRTDGGCRARLKNSCS